MEQAGVWNGTGKFLIDIIWMIVYNYTVRQFEAYRRMYQWLVMIVFLQRDRSH